MDHRAVPIDTLREFARDAAERSSLRHVAAEVGVGRTTLQNFIQAGTSPHPRVKRLLGLWYLREKARLDARAEAESYSAALETLVSGFPGERRSAARATLLEMVERMHLLLDVPPAPGLVQLRQRETDRPRSPAA